MSTNTARKNALARGLGALLDAKPVSIKSEAEAKISEREVRFLPVAQIIPNPRQPRHYFDRDALEELSRSIAAVGVLQPLLVTKNKTTPGQFILLAGERRFRAAQLANLRDVPALISDVTDEEMLEIAIVENVQREDLNAVEEARAYRSLIDQFGWTQEQVSQRIGKNRTTIANALRLLKLGDEALKDIEAGRLTAGHARAILSIEDSFYRQKLRQEILDRAISVREAERLAGRYQQAGSPTGAGSTSSKDSPKGKTDKNRKEAGLDTVALEEKIMVHLGCRVRIVTNDQRSGRVEIPFRNPDELQRFLDALGLPD
jgi:ParB family chromosome partitioning protein